MTVYSESKRKQYMDRKLTHSEYYGLLVEHIGESSLRAMLPGQRTPEQWRKLIEKDPHLNNVPLRQWDALDYYVRGHLLRDGDELVAITGSGGWSLSDSVCVLKETARRYALES